MICEAFRPDLIVCGVSEVEAFTVKVDLRSVHAVFLGSESLESLLNVSDVVGEHEAHDVKAEAIDLVIARIEHEGIDDQLLHHFVFAGRVRAAGAGLQVAICVQAMIVVRHHLIQVGVGTFAAGVGVIEHDVLHNAQPCLVQSMHHRSVFTYAVDRD